MKMKILTCLLFLVQFVGGYAQGTFLFLNNAVPTRIGALEGPLAGPTIWAHMFVGTSAEELNPVDISLPHGTRGIVGARTITVPSIPPLSTAYIQMVAWDSRYWGTDLANVPENQLGRTDIVPHLLSGFSYPVA